MAHTITAEGGTNLSPTAGHTLAAEGGVSLTPAAGHTLAAEGGASLAPAAGYGLVAEAGADLVPSAGHTLAAEGGASLGPSAGHTLAAEGGASLAPAVPDAITSEGGASIGLEVTISGITDPTALNSVLRLGSSLLNGRRQYNLDGGLGGSSGAEANRMRWQGAVSGWLLERYVSNVLTGRFRSYSDVVNPWDATGWTAETGTGAPVVTLTAGPGETGALVAEGGASLSPTAPAQLTPESSY